ncbi:MAG: hypothetical protein GYB65_23885 [Chloroflexi bacterium]|nr:hypothetical protein [Chloroflexota bacterium]
MMTTFITINAITSALIISFFVLSSVLWHISDINRLYVNKPKPAARLIWIPIVLGGTIILAIWIGVVRQWLICHGALLLLTLVVIGLYIRKNALRWIKPDRINNQT